MSTCYIFILVFIIVTVVNNALPTSPSMSSTLLSSPIPSITNSNSSTALSALEILATPPTASASSSPSNGTTQRKGYWKKKVSPKTERPINNKKRQLFTDVIYEYVYYDF